MIDREFYELKKEALGLAETYVEPLLEKYPPEKHVIQQGPSTIISSNGTVVVTPLDQALDSIIKLADWLVNPKTD